MSVDPFAPGLLSARTTGNLFVGLRGELTELQRQLATGKRAESFGGLGFNRRTALDVRGRLAMIDGYQTNIASASLRLSLMNQSLENIAALVRNGKTSVLPGGYTPGSDGLTSAQRQAEEGLKQLIDSLNRDVGGRSLFSGRATDTQPVVTYDLIMNGDTARAGLRQLLAERRLADLGDGLGRLALTSAGTTVTLAEEAAGLPFGFKIEGVAATGGMAATLTSGPPASADVNVASQPADGDTVKVDLALPDGTKRSITLVARTSIDPASTETAFAIGATPAATAANLAAALQTRLATEAAATLSAASAQVAAADFFAGSPNSPPLRVAGPPFDTATATVVGTAANTVVWYLGDDTAASARETAAVRIDATQTVATGAQANESAFRVMFAQFGVLAAQSFPQGDAYSQDRYEAVAERVRTNLDFPLGGQSVEDIAVELALASATITAARERNTATQALLQGVVDDVENVSNEAVAAAILALQTRLEASYQATSILARLSLTNYI